MEGVASEAASIAGHLRLGKLTLIYDDNHITIDGDTALSFSEDVQRRFEAYGWHVLQVADGNDLEAIDRRSTPRRRETARPTLIVLRTHIGDPRPHQARHRRGARRPTRRREVRRDQGDHGLAAMSPRSRAGRCAEPLA